MTKHMPQIQNNKNNRKDQNQIINPIIIKLSKDLHKHPPQKIINISTQEQIPRILQTKQLISQFKDNNNHSKGNRKESKHNNLSKRHHKEPKKKPTFQNLRFKLRAQFVSRFRS